MENMNEAVMDKKVILPMLMDIAGIVTLRWLEESSILVFHFY